MRPKLRSIHSFLFRIGKSMISNLLRETCNAIWLALKEKYLNVPFVIVGDDIFPLKPWLMKPYPGKNLDQYQRIYNYRLSRARRTIENAFGILVAKWRILWRAIRANVALVEKIVQATICLHNYLRFTESANYTPAGFVDCEDSSGNIIPGDWRSEVSSDEGGLRHLDQIGGNRYTFEAGRAGDDFKSYFNSPEGEVPWQLQYVLSCGRTGECNDV